jgi:hypothetical protein
MKGKAPIPVDMQVTQPYHHTCHGVIVEESVYPGGMLKYVPIISTNTDITCPIPIFLVHDADSVSITFKLFGQFECEDRSGSGIKKDRNVSDSGPFSVRF